MKRVAALVVWLALASAACAHDFGAMLVTLAARDDGRVEGVVRVDPEHLPARVAAGLRSADAGEREAARAGLLRALREGSLMWIDGVQSAVTIAPLDEPGKDDGTMRFGVEARSARPATSIAWRCDAPLGRYLLRVTMGGAEESAWLGPEEASGVLGVPGAAPSMREVIVAHVALGFTHIIPHGLDHILFVLGLFLASARLGPVLAQATAFTVAHTITLALAASGVVSPSSTIVEPLIAASIAYVGIENLFLRRYTSRRAIVAFAFGLLHGLGFAGVLASVGLPRGQVVPALVSFNVGVELGQAAVLLAAFALVGAWCGRRRWYRAWVSMPASVAIAAVALVWMVERVGL